MLHLTFDEEDGELFQPDCLSLYEYSLSLSRREFFEPEKRLMLRCLKMRSGVSARVFRRPSERIRSWSRKSKIGYSQKSGTTFFPSGIFVTFCD